MPLHVNLYHEIQHQELARRRDPLRLGMIGLAVIAAGFVAYYCVVLERSHLVGMQYEQLQDEFSRLDPKAKAAKERQDELNDEITASQTMMQNVDGRFYWAPVLDQILKSVPRNVQLTHVGAMSGPSGATNTLSISGISSAIEPRKEAEALRTALAARLATKFKGVTATFKNLEDSEEFVMLDGRRLATATFTIEFQLQPKDPGDAPAAAPARKPKLVADE